MEERRGLRSPKLNDISVQSSAVSLSLSLSLSSLSLSLASLLLLSRFSHSLALGLLLAHCAHRTPPLVYNRLICPSILCTLSLLIPLHKPGWTLFAYTTSTKLVTAFLHTIHHSPPSSPFRHPMGDHCICSSYHSTSLVSTKSTAFSAPNATVLPYASLKSSIFLDLFSLHTHD